jgi:hypothetical protein
MQEATKKDARNNQERIDKQLKEGREAIGRVARSN